VPSLTVKMAIMILKILHLKVYFIHSFTKWTPMMSDDDMNVNSKGFDANTVTVFFSQLQ